MASCVFPALRKSSSIARVAPNWTLGPVGTGEGGGDGVIRAISHGCRLCGGCTQHIMNGGNTSGSFRLVATAMLYKLRYESPGHSRASMLLQ